MGLVFFLSRLIYFQCVCQWKEKINKYWPILDDDADAGDEDDDEER